ncbi:MAG: hypothetical protein Q4G51_01435 [Dermatophilus congolensis]|nr:hypothetical protein [Dermatophilus congolensis]
MKRGLGVVLALVLVVAVGLALWLGPRLGGGAEGLGGSGGAGQVQQGAQVTQVSGLVGSEKAPFFADPKVREAFARNGLEVTVTSSGSRDMATRPDLKSFGFAFPSSEPAGDRVKRAAGVTETYTPFRSPLAIASFTPVVDVLAKAKVATKSGDTWMFDVAAYLQLAGKGTRWNALPGNSAYPASKNVLVTTTDVRRSNSAEMFLALASYVANGGTMVTNAATVNKVVPAVAPLFIGQGYVGGSSEGPFEDYLSAGMGKTPMVLVYESQLLGRQLAKDGAITDQMTVMYPTPDIISKHTLVPISPDGDRVGRLLSTDPDLVRLAAEHGFRPNDRKVFVDAVTAAGVPAPPELVNVVEPPTTEVLEQLTAGVEKLYGGTQ